MKRNVNYIITFKICSLKYIFENNEKSYWLKKYQIKAWDMITHNYQKLWTKGKYLKPVLKYTKPVSIVVFHDSEKASERTLFVLPKLMEAFRMKMVNFLEFV